MFTTFHSPCSCRGCPSACPAVAAEDPLGDIPWHPASPGWGPRGPGGIT